MHIVGVVEVVVVQSAKYLCLIVTIDTMDASLRLEATFALRQQTLPIFHCFGHFPTNDYRVWTTNSTH